MISPCAWRVRLALYSLALVAGVSAQVPNGGVIMVTDMTDEGRKIRRPDRTNPVYYQAVNVGFNSFGRSIAGDREPPNDEILQLILRTLRDEGYLPSSDEHPPNLVLGFAWGDLRGNWAGALQVLGAEKLDLQWEIDQAAGKYPWIDPRALTRNIRSPMQDRVMSLASDDLYLVNIAAYDRDRAVRGELVLLWQTRIACSARGNWAKDLLPQLVKVSGPALGRETDKPQWIPPSDFERETEVKIGELTTVESYDLEKVPVLDLTKEK